MYQCKESMRYNELEIIEVEKSFAKVIKLSSMKNWGFTCRHERETEMYQGKES